MLKSSESFSLTHTLCVTLYWFLVYNFSKTFANLIWEMTIYTVGLYEPQRNCQKERKQLHNE